MSNETKPGLALEDLAQAEITDDGGGLNTVRLRIRGTSVASVWYDDARDREFSTAEALRVARAIKVLPDLIRVARAAAAMDLATSDPMDVRVLAGNVLACVEDALAALEPETDHPQNEPQQ